MADSFEKKGLSRRDVLKEMLVVGFAAAAGGAVEQTEPQAEFDRMIDDLFDTFAAREKGEDVEGRLDALFKNHEAYLYLLYLNYKESEILGSPPDDDDPEYHIELQIYEWLDEPFKELEE